MGSIPSETTDTSKVSNLTAFKKLATRVDLEPHFMTRDNFSFPIVKFSFLGSKK